jgi:hypothetical protein
MPPLPGSDWHQAVPKYQYPDGTPVDPSHEGMITENLGTFYLHGMPVTRIGAALPSMTGTPSAPASAAALTVADPITGRKQKLKITHEKNSTFARRAFKRDEIR